MDVYKAVHTGVWLIDCIDVYRAVRVDDYGVFLVCLVLRIRRALELCIKLRVELRAEPRVELLSRAFEQSSVQSLE